MNSVMTFQHLLGQMTLSSHHSQEDCSKPARLFQTDHFNVSTLMEPMNSLPQLPTLAETVFPGFNYSLWGGLFAPGGTPKNVIQSLNKEINQILALPEIKAQMEKDSLAVPSNTSQEFTNYISAESVKFEKLVTDAKLKLDN
jgi:tripartite-type tricarboxylate transporter receptor subunit TctC